MKVKIYLIASLFCGNYNSASILTQRSWKQFRNLCVLLLGIATAQYSYAGSLPEFDDNNYEVLSVEISGKAFVKSNGRYFFCDTISNEPAGYVQLSGCLLFAFGSEIPDADVAAAAAADAENLKIKENMTASISAAIASLDPKRVGDMLISFSKDNKCKLLIGSKDVSNSDVINLLAEQLGGGSIKLDEQQQNGLRSVAASAVQMLIDAEQGTLSTDGTSIKFKKCK
jgi:hypothetical protein